MVLSAAVAGASGTDARTPEAFITCDGSADAVVIAKDTSVSGTLSATTVETNTVQSSGSTVTISDGLLVTGEIRGENVLYIDEIQNDDSGFVYINDQLSVEDALTGNSSIIAREFYSTRDTELITSGGNETIYTASGSSERSFLLTVEAIATTGGAAEGHASGIVAEVNGGLFYTSIASADIAVSVSGLTDLVLTNNTGVNATVTWSLMRLGR